MLKNPFIRFSSLKKYQDLVSRINTLEDELKILTDNELRLKNLKLKKQYKIHKNLNSLIIESFALTREASLRTLGLRHFDVQLIGGLALNDQQITEMQTGEGKTLVATLPASLNGLTNNGVHIITVNEYLANRDQVSMSQIYRFLGLSTGLIKDEMTLTEKKENYNADITYVTNYAVAFDFLNDNLVMDKNEMTLRPFNYCIIDEVDSVLIDEAQTPLIISNDKEIIGRKYITASEIDTYLKLNIDYEVSEKNNNVTLTEEGLKKIEKMLGVQTLYDKKDPWMPYIINAIKASSLYSENIHYIIDNNEIVIVDDFTGRVMPDRRWGEGLHQAIEAKENLPISKETETIATISYQNFFLLYDKLAGMTGTGKTAEVEFKRIYKLSVQEIPTARPSQRKDLPELIYKDQLSKWNAITNFCSKIYLKGQPILLGTTSIEKSEMLAKLISEYKLKYQILNAKPENVRKESEIVAQAGKRNTITIATNMAGRGTDIILGGNINLKIQTNLYRILTWLKNYTISQQHNLIELSLFREFPGISHKFVSVLLSLINNRSFLKLSDFGILYILRKNDQIFSPTISYQCSIKFLISELSFSNKKQQLQERKVIKNLGGLCVIGTERNASKRVDNQLRGRCGRQGDPGVSRFFLSLDDNLLRLFGGPRIQNFLQAQIPDDSPIKSKVIENSLNLAQRRIEERAFEQRRKLFEYDKVLNKQRNLVYSQRKNLFELKSVQQITCGLVEQYLVEIFFYYKKISIEEQVLIIEDLWEQIVYYKNSGRDRENLLRFKTYFINKFWLTYRSKLIEVSLYDAEVGKSWELLVILSAVDKMWHKQLEQITMLREISEWKGYGQREPLSCFKEDSYTVFKCSMRLWGRMIFHSFLNIQIA